MNSESNSPRMISNRILKLRNHTRRQSHIHGRSVAITYLFLLLVLLAQSCQSFQIQSKKSSLVPKAGWDTLQTKNNHRHLNFPKNAKTLEYLKTKLKEIKTRSIATILASTILTVPVIIEFFPTTTPNDFLSQRSDGTAYMLSSFGPILRQSRAMALTEQQLLVDDVWREVTRQYVDRTFNGMGEEGWRKQRLEAVTKVSQVGPDDTEFVYKVIRNMLATLKDPYTRFLTPEQFESLTAYAKGTTQSQAGIGVQLVPDPGTGRIVVLNTISDGPASKQGILPGDVIIEVDEMNVEGATPEVVAAKCRGEAGTKVTLTIRHGRSDGRSEEQTTKISVQRSPLKNSKSVESSVFVSENEKTKKKQKIGLLKVSSFNQETEKNVIEALKSLHNTDAIVVDLRGNVGGYMPAGVDVAKLFLPPQVRVVSEVDKSGRVTIYVNDGVGSDTSVPLYVLVDKRTASASEILAAALQDNHRAIVVGSSSTFGKGRIQNLQELQDGSGLAVTKAKYITPNGRDIQGVGIAPDVASKRCGPEDSPATCLEGII